MDSVSQTSRRSSLNYTYDAWSNITASTGTLATTNPWHFASNYADAATGHLKLGARYYNPTTGRFTQPDPSGQESNAYASASDNPINLNDPSGLIGAGEVLMATFGLVATAAAVVAVIAVTPEVTLVATTVGIIFGIAGGMITVGCLFTENC